MKRIISFVLVTVLTIIGTFTATAAETEGSTGTVEATKRTYQQISKIKVNKDRLYFYPYNLSENNNYVYQLDDENYKTVFTLKFADTYNHFTTKAIDSSMKYRAWAGLTGAMSSGGIESYIGADGFYDVVKIKLSDYSDYFNADGSHTEFNSLLDEDFTYTFTTQKPNKYATVNSALFFVSGAAVTCAVPDENGEVEVVVSRNPKHTLTFSTQFDTADYSSGHFKSVSGGGKNNVMIISLRAGDVNLDGSVSISDVTTLQRQIAEYLSLSDLQNRNADLNKDKAISIKDVTIIQKYLAQFDISQYYK